MISFKGEGAAGTGFGGEIGVARAVLRSERDAENIVAAAAPAAAETPATMARVVFDMAQLNIYPRNLKSLNGREIDIAIMIEFSLYKLVSSDQACQMDDAPA